MSFHDVELLRSDEDSSRRVNEMEESPSEGGGGDKRIENEKMTKENFPDMFEEKNSIIWKVIDKYFKEDSRYLVAHHLDTYNDFYRDGIYKIIKENKLEKKKYNF